MSKIELSFLGGAKEVGRSSILVSYDNLNVLLDCGINLGAALEEKYPLDPPQAPDLLIVTHAHLDHSGFAPAIVRRFKCPFYATPPTQDLSELLYFDSLRLAKESGEDFPYKNSDVTNLRKYAVDMRYRVPVKFKDDLTVTFYSAGHILGSSMVLLEFKDHTLLYTGDISMRNTRTLSMCDIAINSKVDTLIIESTYGGTNDRHKSLQKTDNEFAKAVKSTLEKGGKVIIPVFAVGRAQQVMLTLEDYIRSNFIEKVPIYIDGLIRKVNKIYRLFWEWLRPEIQRRIRYTHRSPLESRIFIAVKDRESILKKDEPCVIITTSGMIEGGPVLKYLECLGGDENNLICLTGYQVPKTRGRTLLEGGKVIRINDKDVEIKADVKYFEFSAHADRPGLFRFISNLKSVKTVLCVHGEENKAISFASGINKLKGIEAHAPSVGETLVI
ncbi:MAG: MBL fold metallo-hydrolase RNA specificity domain-containing protein [Candidatus Odinarchaeia archaeon]